MAVAPEAMLSGAAEALDSSDRRRIGEVRRLDDVLARLRDGQGEPAPLDLDMSRELKRVNGHLVAAAAYPVLEDQGELLSSRLRLDP